MMTFLSAELLILWSETRNIIKMRKWEGEKVSFVL